MVFFFPHQCKINSILFLFLFTFHKIPPLRCLMFGHWCLLHYTFVFRTHTKQQKTSLHFINVDMIKTRFMFGALSLRSSLCLLIAPSATVNHIFKQLLELIKLSPKNGIFNQKIHYFNCLKQRHYIIQTIMSKILFVVKF